MGLIHNSIRKLISNLHVVKFLKQVLSQKQLKVFYYACVESQLEHTTNEKYIKEAVVVIELNYIVCFLNIKQLKLLKFI